MSYASRVRAQRLYESRRRPWRKEETLRGQVTVNKYDMAREVACRAAGVPYGAVDVAVSTEVKEVRDATGKVIGYSAVSADTTARSYETGEKSAARQDDTRPSDAYIERHRLYADRAANRHHDNYRQAKGSKSVTAALDALDTAARASQEG